MHKEKMRKFAKVIQIVQGEIQGGSEGQLK